jgi:hypothetical protein
MRAANRANARHRTTTGVIDQIAANGVVFVREAETMRRGFVANNVPISGKARLKRGTLLTLDVEDRGNVMVVSSARVVSD